MARNTRTRRIALAAGLPAAATSAPEAVHQSVRPAVVGAHHHGRHVEPGDRRGRANEPGEDVRGQEREPGDDRGQNRREDRGDQRRHDRGDDRGDHRGGSNSGPGNDDSGHDGSGHDGGDD